MSASDEVRTLAARWIASALGDLALARAVDGDDEAPARGVAFFASQALEKGLKAILVWEQLEFPRTHDLALLAALVPSGWELGIPAGQLARLSDFAVDTRYPIDDWSLVRPVSAEEADDALATVGPIVERIIDRLPRPRIGRA